MTNVLVHEPTAFVTLFTLGCVAMFTINDTVTTSISTFTTSIDTVTTSINTVTTSIDTVTTSISTFTTSIDTVTTLINTVTTSIDTVTASNNTVTTSIHTVTTPINTVTTSIDTVTTSNNKVTTPINTSWQERDPMNPFFFDLGLVADMLVNDGRKFYSTVDHVIRAYSMARTTMARPLTREIAGMKWSHYFPEECVRSALAYQACPNDVFIVSYPKCGSTWLQYLVYNIYSGGVPPRHREEFLDNINFLEMIGAERSTQRSRPGTMKTHLPFSRQRYNPQSRYLYITRNPFDCCVSYFYHIKHHPGYCFSNGTFDDFFELFVTGELEFGDYFDHVLSWYPHREDPNVLFLTYEDLKRDTAASVVKIAAFLGDEYQDRLRREPGLVGRILEAAALDSMKKIFNSCDFAAKDEKNATNGKDPTSAATKQLSVEELVRAPLTGEFVRKGAVGDWKAHMSPAQVHRLLERIRVKTAGSDVMDLWKDIDIPR